jgi:hypothetical protein
MAHVYPFAGPRVLPSRFKHGCSTVTKPCVIEGSVSGDIITKMRTTLSAPPPSKFVPVENYADYVNDLKRHGTSDEEAAVIYEKHRAAMAEYPVKPKESKVKRVVQPIAPISLIMLIDEKSGKVGVKLDTTTWPMHQKYFAKGIKPPQGVYVRSLLKAGHTEETCMKVIAKYQWYIDNAQALQDELERVWPSSKSKKTEVVKKVLKAVKKL